MSPSVPRPAAASASAAGDPRPPTPMTSALASRNVVGCSLVDRMGQLLPRNESEGRALASMRFLIFRGSLRGAYLASELAPRPYLYGPVAVASQGRALRHSGWGMGSLLLGKEVAWSGTACQTQNAGGGGQSGLLGTGTRSLPRAVVALIDPALLALASIFDEMEPGVRALLSRRRARACPLPRRSRACLCDSTGPRCTGSSTETRSPSDREHDGRALAKGNPAWSHALRLASARRNDRSLTWCVATRRSNRVCRSWASGASFRALADLGRWHADERR